MKKEIADKWVAALRSGQYKQAQSVLRRKDGFCCLGVLCELSAKDGVGTWGEESCAHTYDFFTAEDVQDSELPSEVKKWAGMNSNQGSIPSLASADHLPDQPPVPVLLSKLNDDGISFDDIAGLIEKHWEEL